MPAKLDEMGKRPSALETVAALPAALAFFEFVRDARAAWAYDSKGYFAFLTTGAVLTAMFVAVTTYRWVRWARH